MRIEGNTIIFKSAPESYYKEREGLKPNTVRRISLWSEMKEFEEFINKFIFTRKNETLLITIINSITHEEFTRKITDITEFEGVFIFSWKHEV